MKVLALELSTKRGSVSVGKDGDEIFAREFPNDRRNSAGFFEAVSAARETFDAIDIIVAGLGPGSYAGTRIAISTAIGIQLATGAMLLGLPSICAFDVQEREYCVVGDARRKSFWIATIADAACVGMPELMSESELRPRLACARSPIYSAERLPQFANVALAFPSATRLASIASADHANAMPAPLQPLYLREAHITMSKQPVWNHAS